MIRVDGYGVIKIGDGRQSMGTSTFAYPSVSDGGTQFFQVLGGSNVIQFRDCGHYAGPNQSNQIKSNFICIAQNHNS